MFHLRVSAFSFLLLASSSACDSHDHTHSVDEHGAMAGDGGSHSHDHESHDEVPHPYQGLHNPVANDAQAVQQGARLYADHCASCHGAEGRGDGQSAAHLDPPPDALTEAHVQEADADYLFYRITEGGEGPNSAMPAFEAQLTEMERWQLIAFLRTLDGE